MKSFENIKMGIQGDIAITRISTLPTGLTRVKSENGQLIVAHSETGHNHAVAERDAGLYQDPNDAMVAYLTVNGSVDLKHHRSYDTHETVRFDTGVYRINRQREYTAEGFRKVQD